MKWYHPSPTDQCRHPSAIRDLIETYRDVLKFLALSKIDLERQSDYPELLALVRLMDVPLRYIAKQLGLRHPREALDTNN